MYIIGGYLGSPLGIHESVLAVHLITWTWEEVKIKKFPMKGTQIILFAIEILSFPLIYNVGLSCMRLVQIGSNEYCNPNFIDLSKTKFLFKFQLLHLKIPLHTISIFQLITYNVRTLHKILNSKKITITCSLQGDFFRRRLYSRACIAKGLC